MSQSTRYRYGMVELFTYFLLKNNIVVLWAESVTQRGTNMPFHSTSQKTGGDCTRILVKYTFLVLVLFCRPFYGTKLLLIEFDSS